MARVAIGVGVNASRPSWKISGFGYMSRGSVFQHLFSVSVAV